MTYNEIYTRFLLYKIDDPFLKSLATEENEEILYSILNGYLHATIAIPYVNKLFTSIRCNDENRELTYEFENSVDEDLDKEFLLEILTKGMVLQWMTPKIDTSLSLAQVIGGKEEKVLKNDYKANIERLAELKRELRKMIRDSNYQNNSYLKED